MRLSICQQCGQRVYFENISCIRCGAILGFDPDTLQITTFSETEDAFLKPVNSKTVKKSYRRCANWINHDVCNWVVASDDPQELCVACRLNRTIPDLTKPENNTLWLKIEVEKRRLIYSLLSLKLPTSGVDENTQSLAFDFLADTEETFSEQGRVLTGHADGLITLNINEADPVLREKMRKEMAEPYRTLLGHFRHESGHYYWDLLVRDTQWLAPVRELFGDDTLDYSQALQRHYESGPAADWQANHISAYASMHPWEDWAETWAHYLHIVDTLETAHEFGLKLQPDTPAGENLQADVEIDPYKNNSFSEIIRHWLPLSYALNSLSRSMGHEHLYPFVLAEPVIKKLDLVNRIVHNQFNSSDKIDSIS